ncbi:MAG: hypothetical protein Q9220_007529 [cf. Caloplaca sp. 1 TL-2023]
MILYPQTCGQMPPEAGKNKVLEIFKNLECLLDAMRATDVSKADHQMHSILETEPRQTSLDHRVPIVRVSVLRGGFKKKERTSGSGFGGGGFNAKEVGDEPSAKELDYLNTRDSISTFGELVFEGGTTKHTKAGHERVYQTSDVSSETLQGMGPAIACGEWGMSETVGERLIQINKSQDEYDERIQKLAHKWAEGEFCHFSSPAERQNTMKTVEMNLAGQGDNAKLNEEKEEEKMALMDTRLKEEREKLATRLLKGDYYIGPLGKGATAELLERYTSKNETYMPKDIQTLAGKIGTLLPLGKAATPANAVEA